MIKKLNLFRNTFVSFSPGVISIFVSLFSIPLFLNILNSSYFGQYLIQNLFFTLGFLLNFGIYRLIIINNMIKDKFASSLKNTFYIQINIVLSLFFSTLIFFSMYLINLRFNFSTLDLILNKYIFIGLILSSIFFSIESIQKINEKFYQLAFFNLSFNALSFSAPAFYLYFKSNYYHDYIILSYPEELISIVVFLKILSVLIFFLILLDQKKIGNLLSLTNKMRLKKKDFEEIFYATNQSLIFFLNNLTDKFLVKITLGNSFLTLYSVPQQIAAKSTILVTGISSVFFPKISKISSLERKKVYLRYVVKITIFFSGFISFCIYPFIDPLIKFWLKNSFNEIYVPLIKVFLFYSFFASLNFLISQFIDSEKKIKNNTIIDISFFFVTLIFFFISMKLKMLIFFAASICLREVLIFCFKCYHYNLTSLIKYEIKPIIFFSIFLILGINIVNIYFYIISIILIIFYSLSYVKIKDIVQNFKKIFNISNV